MNLPSPAVAALPSSPDAYIRHGWKLTAIPQNSKGPTHAGWNRIENALTTSTLPDGYGFGLLHGYSGTMALDVDDWQQAQAWLAERGVDLAALVSAPDAVGIDSGNPGHAKLLYALDSPLPTKRIGSNGRALLEFRCGTSNGLSSQDVLPPSIHITTLRPYQWVCAGHWTRLPPLPDALRLIWTGLLEQDSQRTIATGEKVPTSWDEVRAALWAISPDCSREVWIACGMALHHAGAVTDQAHGALVLWDEWSATSATKYPGRREIDTQWKSMRADKLTAVTLGTLFHHAREAGWTRPVPDVTSLFSAVEAPSPPSILTAEGLFSTPPDMDMSLWPAALRAVAEELSATIGCDPIVPLVAGLSAACAVAHGESRLELMDGFSVPPVLWLCTIGRPSDKKSPASRPMMDVLRALEDDERKTRNAGAMNREAERAFYEASKDDFIKAATKGLKGADLPLMPDEVHEPIPLRLTVSDITSQKLVRYAAERPEGFLCYLDEMGGWARKVCDPRSGEDRSAWVQAYEAAPYNMDRVGAGAIYASNFAMSIYGNIQPAVLREHINVMCLDGLLQRFLPFPLRQQYTRRGEPLPPYLSCKPPWDTTLRLIHAIGVQHYTLSPEAFVRYREFQTWYEQFKRDEVILGAHDHYMTAIGKIEGTVGRMALMWQLIEEPFAKTVSGDLMARVIETVRGYCIPALRHVLNELGGLETESIVPWVREHVIQYASEAETLTLSQIRRSARRRVGDMPLWQAHTQILDAMEPLERARWVLRIEDNARQDRVTWAINPALSTLFVDYRLERLKAKQRLIDEKRNVAGGGARRVIVGYDPATMD